MKMNRYFDRLKTSMSSKKEIKPLKVSAVRRAIKKLLINTGIRPVLPRIEDNGPT